MQNKGDIHLFVLVIQSAFVMLTVHTLLNSMRLVHEQPA